MVISTTFISEMAMLDTTLTTVIIVMDFFIDVSVNGNECLSESKKTMVQCINGHARGSEVLMDFSELERVQSTYCSCNIYILSGTKLSFSPFYYPGYYGCGTYIKIHFITTSIIRCIRAADTLNVNAGDAVTIEIWRESPIHSDASYCYSIMSYGYNGLDMYPGTMIVTCDRPIDVSTTSDPTTFIKSTLSVITSSIQTHTSGFNPPSSEITTVSSTHEGQSSVSFVSDEMTSTRSTVIRKTTSEIEATVTMTTQKSLHLPWEIITPVSLIATILIVVAVVVCKTRKGNKRRLSFTPSILEATKKNWSFTLPKNPPSTKIKKQNGNMWNGTYMGVDDDKSRDNDIPSGRYRFDVTSCTNNEEFSSCQSAPDLKVCAKSISEQNSVDGFTKLNEKPCCCDTVSAVMQMETLTHKCFDCSLEAVSKSSHSDFEQAENECSNDTPNCNDAFTSFKTREDCEPRTCANTKGDTFVDPQSNGKGYSEEEDRCNSTTASDNEENKNTDIPPGLSKRRKSYISTAAITIGAIGVDICNVFQDRGTPNKDIESNSRDAQDNATGADEPISRNKRNSNPLIDIWATF